MVKIILAHISLLFANLIYAINYSFAKDVMPTFIMPSGFILLRVVGAFLLFFLLYKIFIHEKIEIKDLLRLVACGFFGVAVNQLFFFEGLNLSTPINASIIMTINPIIVIIISFFILKESFGIKKIFGVLLGLVGAGLLILNKGEIDLSNNLRTGNILVLINASSYAFYLVIVKPLMTKYNPITILTYVFGFGMDDRDGSVLGLEQGGDGHAHDVRPADHHGSFTRNDNVGPLQQLQTPDRRTRHRRRLLAAPQT